MKTKEQILEAIANGKNSEAIDGRDFARLCKYFPQEQYSRLGFELRYGAEPFQLEELTEENILLDLKEDLALAFKKALDQRGISAGLMYQVVKMWLWVLDDELADWNDSNYAQYGLPLFKAVAVKYGFDNPIGDDRGDEECYAF